MKAARVSVRKFSIAVEKHPPLHSETAAPPKVKNSLLN
jgi:hypothetical protein